MPSDEYMAEHAAWERDHVAHENEVMQEIRDQQDAARKDAAK